MKFTIRRTQASTPCLPRRHGSLVPKPPHLDAEEPVLVSVGGVPGTQLDVSVSSAPDNYLKDCVNDKLCLPLLPAADGSWYGFPKGQGERMIILGVRGETVIVTSVGPESKGLTSCCSRDDGFH